MLRLLFKQFVHSRTIFDDILWGTKSSGNDLFWRRSPLGDEICGGGGLPLGTRSSEGRDPLVTNSSRGGGGGPTLDLAGPNLGKGCSIDKNIAIAILLICLILFLLFWLL